MKSLRHRKPGRFGNDQKTHRRNACRCIWNHVKRKRQGTEEIFKINLEYKIKQKSNSIA